MTRWITAGRVETGLRVALVAASAIFPLMFLVVGIVRMTYPFELEWMEGGSVDHVRRVIEGRALYVEPGVEFTPYIYTPLYFWVSAVPASVLGATFLPLRLVSVLSTLGCFALLFAIVRRESGSPLGGLVAAGFYAATYHVSDTWFDLARVDSMFMALLLLGLWLLRRRRDVLHHALGGLAFALAFLTKQTTLVISLPILLWCVICHRGWLRVVFPVAFALPAGLACLGLDAASDGWFQYYVFDLPGQHPLRRFMWVDFWTRDILGPTALALVVSVLHMVLLPLRGRREDLWFHLALFAGMMGAAWSARLHDGGWTNSLMPAHATLAMGLGCGSAMLLDEAASRSRLAAGFVCAAALAQLLGILWIPGHQIPSVGDAEGGRRVLRVIDRFEGPVLVPNHGYIQSMVGKPTNSGGMATFDVIRGTDADRRDALVAEWREALRSGRWEAVILSERGVVDDGLRPDLERWYEYRGEIFEGEDVFWPQCGHSMRPSSVWVRKR